MSKRVTSGGAHLSGLELGQHSMKKCRSGGDPLATLSVYDLLAFEIKILPWFPH